MSDSLQYQLKGLMNRNRDGSFATQSARKSILVQAAKDLKNAGFRNMKPESLKQKHVEHLVKSWREQKLTPGTIKNRMSHVRWWSEKIGKTSMIPTNSELRIDKRSYIPDENRATKIDSERLSRINDEHVKLSLEMQREFGLRREEAIKFMPSYAIQQNHIKLKSSWTKGGRERTVPIKTESQRTLLARVQNLVKNGALIPTDRNYKIQLNVYKNETSRVEMDFNHGLRHSYAQQRYLVITGTKCSIAGGLQKNEMTKEQREIDQAARLIISAELGHERESITNTYLGN